ncbi:oxidoreductase [Kocuria polaris]|nr:oxidoreductase [Kocuria polaris]
MAEKQPAGVVLVGLNGFGRQHLINIERLVALGKMRLLAGVDFNDPGPEIRGADTPVFASLDDVAAAGIDPDIVIVSTPINTHHDLALRALEFGADLYLEKPPTATLGQYESLLSAADAAGARVQVGFQSIGSHALDALADLLRPAGGAPGPIGSLRTVGASGTWVRTRGYYDRAPWAGHRVLNGVQVVDGVATNPLAHAVQTALHIAGARTSDDVVDLATELHHAHRIEADDTTNIRLTTAGGVDVTCALTVCAAEQQDPWITVHGTEGHAVLYYTRDELVVTPNPDSPGAGQDQRTTFGRTNLLENLIDVRAGSADALLSPLADTGAFMRVLESIRTAADPAQIRPEDVTFAGEGADERPIVPHIENLIDRAVKGSSTFSSLGAPWAAAPAVSGTLAVTPAGSTLPVPVADLRTGEEVSAANGPRPFLDRVRTLSGVVVTDQQPLDHTWHLGVSVALQDVEGHNFWGGRTYTRAAGRYVWRADHGRIRTRSESVINDAEADGTCGQRLRARLEWTGYDGAALLTEERQVSARPVAAEGLDGWELDFAFCLAPAGADPVALGSPGSNGRAGGGYGGFFWRMPALGDARIYTATAEGEEAVHGTVSDWLAISADFASNDGHPLDGTDAQPEVGSGRGPATLVFVSADSDPWFVRCAGYPGIGASLAWDAPALTSPDAPVRRRIRTIVLDGIVPRERIEALVSSLVKA